MYLVFARVESYIEMVAMIQDEPYDLYRRSSPHPCTQSLEHHPTMCEWVGSVWSVSGWGVCGVWVEVCGWCGRKNGNNLKHTTNIIF